MGHIYFVENTPLSIFALAAIFQINDFTPFFFDFIPLICRPQQSPFPLLKIFNLLTKKKF